MLWSKMQCVQCEHYHECPHKTRMFINYCGSRRERVASEIEAARSDCRTRRTFVVQYRRPSMLNLRPATHPQH